jgi:hypothetical protein
MPAVDNETLSDFGTFLKDLGRRYFGDQELEAKPKTISLAALRRLAGGERGKKGSVRFDSEGGYQEL